jgi:hypothetical protein
MAGAAAAEEQETEVEVEEEGRVKRRVVDEVGSGGKGTREAAVE